MSTSPKIKKIYKSSVTVLATYFEKSREKWKQRALVYQKRIDGLEIKVRDLQKSRDNWKKQAKEIKKK